MTETEIKEEYSVESNIESALSSGYLDEDIIAILPQVMKITEDQVRQSLNKYKASSISSLTSNQELCRLKLFEYDDNELANICIQAELDENNLLKIDESNVVRIGGIIFFKRPILASRAAFVESREKQAIISKDSDDIDTFFTFALANTNESREKMYVFYESEHLSEKGYDIKAGLSLKLDPFHLVSLWAVD